MMYIKSLLLLVAFTLVLAPCVAQRRVIIKPVGFDASPELSSREEIVQANVLKGIYGCSDFTVVERKYLDDVMAELKLKETLTTEAVDVLADLKVADEVLLASVPELTVYQSESSGQYTCLITLLLKAVEVSTSNISAVHLLDVVGDAAAEKETAIRNTVKLLPERLGQEVCNKPRKELGVRLSDNPADIYFKAFSGYKTYDKLVEITYHYNPQTNSGNKKQIETYPSLEKFKSKVLKNDFVPVYITATKINFINKEIMYIQDFTYNTKNYIIETKVTESVIHRYNSLTKKESEVYPNEEEAFKNQLALVELNPHNPGFRNFLFSNNNLVEYAGESNFNDSECYVFLLKYGNFTTRYYVRRNDFNLLGQSDIHITEDPRVGVVASYDDWVHISTDTSDVGIYIKEKKSTTRIAFEGSGSQGGFSWKPWFTEVLSARVYQEADGTRVLEKVSVTYQ